jgi:hypothetical protein
MTMDQASQELDAPPISRTQVFTAAAMNICIGAAAGAGLLNAIFDGEAEPRWIPTLEISGLILALCGLVAVGVAFQQRRTYIMRALQFTMRFEESVSFHKYGDGERPSQESAGVVSLKEAEARRDELVMIGEHRIAERLHRAIQELIAGNLDASGRLKHPDPASSDSS